MGKRLIALVGGIALGVGCASQPKPAEQPLLNESFTSGPAGSVTPTQKKDGLSVQYERLQGTIGP